LLLQQWLLEESRQHGFPAGGWSLLASVLADASSNSNERPGNVEERNEEKSMHEKHASTDYEGSCLPCCHMALHLIVMVFCLSHARRKL
jgi:hypothetical protein